MKKEILMGFVWLAGAIFSLAEVVIGTPSSVPESGVALQQLNEDKNGIQSRNQKSDRSNWRGAAQLFQWNTDAALDGIGLKFGSNQKNLFKADQAYVLVVQRIEDACPVSTELMEEFVLLADKVQSGA